MDLAAAQSASPTSPPTPPQIPPARRLRSSTSRSRTGCASCRIRHVKCDETYPSCLRCTKTGRVCDGYTQRTTRPTSIADSLSVQAYAIPFRIPGSASARRLLHYYCVRGAPDLGNPDRSGFWDNLVLRYSYNFLPVRQALLALSIVHLEHYTKEPSHAPQCIEGELDGISPLQRLQLISRHRKPNHSSTMESLSQYCKALQCLQRYLKSDPDPCPTAVVVCCILLHLFDCQRQEYKAAMAHLQGALQIFGVQSLSQHVVKSASVTAEDSAMIAQALGQMDLRASNYDNQAPLGHLTSAAERSGAVDCISVDSFQTLAEASFALDRVYNWTLHFFRAEHAINDAGMSQMPPHLSAEKEQILRQLSRWSAAFDSLEKQMELPHVNSLDRQFSKRLLLTYRGIYLLFTSKDTASGHPPCDGGAGSLAVETLDLAQELVQQFRIQCSSANAQALPELNSPGLSPSQRSYPKSHDRDERFSPIASVFAVVMFIALRARNVDIRRRAVELLNETVDAREGFLDSCMAVGNLRLWADHTERARKWTKPVKASGKGTQDAEGGIESSFTALERDLWGFDCESVLQPALIDPSIL